MPIKPVSRFAFFVLLVLPILLSGCGSSPGSEGFPTKIIIQLIDASTSLPTNTISFLEPGELHITLKDADGKRMANQYVEVTSTKGILSPVDGTAITNQDGVAVVGLSTGNDTGAGVVTVFTDGATVDPLTGELTFGVITENLFFQIGLFDVRLGSFSGPGGTFAEGVLDPSVEQLAAGGTATMTAALADATGNPVTSPSVNISFTSVCAANELSVIDASVATFQGEAEATYRADGCVGTDLISATAALGGQDLTASATITVASAAINSILFVSATPQAIVLDGTGCAGCTQHSIVVFQLVDIFGKPVPSQNVDFSLSTLIGGLSLSNETATSDANGLVQTVVQAGSVATHVRVMATVADTAISTLSDEIAVSTGLPDQDSFSVSAETLNPEAWDNDGVTVPITIRAADHFNNPVPDGTTIVFSAEGGAIQSSCRIVDGSCFVNWSSQAPRPQADGRVTILATSIGEESFFDGDGDGVYGSLVDSLSGADLGEPYMDNNENGARNGIEEFRDFNYNGIFDGTGNSIYNGALCSDLAELAGLCTQELVFVQKSVVLVMSGSDAYISFSADSVDLTTATGDASQEVVITVVDAVHNQLMPFGTTIEAETSNGTLDGETAFTVPNNNCDATDTSILLPCGTNTSGRYTFRVRLIRESETNSRTLGFLTIKVTTPAGIVTSAEIAVTDDS
jgi:hypothetical protein